MNEIANYFNQPTDYILVHRVEPFETLCDNAKIKNQFKLGILQSQLKNWLKT